MTAWLQVETLWIKITVIPFELDFESDTERHKLNYKHWYLELLCFSWKLISVENIRKIKLIFYYLEDIYIRYTN